MDRHFLEFWGNFLLQAAQGQKQLEDFAKWFKRPVLNLGDFTALFRQAYGLDPPKQDSPDYPAIWKKAEEDFRNSFQEYLSLLGVVPRREYAELARKYEKLEAKLAEREETIKHLRHLLSDKGLDYAVVSLELQELMKKQGEKFQELVEDFGKTSKEGATNMEKP
jgi:tetratricopeptide (TPR) repeat protein